MAYTDIAARAADPEFLARLQACAVEQAQVFKDDDRPDFSVLAEQIIGHAPTALGMASLVSAAPVAGDLDTDPVLLSAVQYAWPIYGATRQP